MRKLFSPDPTRIGRPDVMPAPDAIPMSLAGGSPPHLRAAMEALLGKAQVLHRAIDLVRYASDASPYRYIPQIVVLPRHEEDIARILAYCRANGHKATFRSAGTSLNGQAQSGDILIDVRRHWQGCTVEQGGARLRARTGTVLGHANARLARLGRKLGPDPASNSACTIGGVVANNAGGMRCTIERDAYHTLVDCTFILPSGTRIDTADPQAEALFAAAEPVLAEGLMALRAELLADPALVARVRRKYSIRNTHGLRLCALLDGETPLAIFRRLLVGSEGTLAFMAEVVMETIPLDPVTGVAFLIFPSIDAAVARVGDLVALRASAVELMVAPALTAAGEAFPGTPGSWKDLDPGAAALLVEFGAADVAGLTAKEDAVIALFAGGGLLQPVQFTSVEQAVELAWHVREGLLGLLGKKRTPGTLLITEDVCFPRENLAQGAHDVQALLSKHGYIPSVAGHAAHGNLHFPLIARFDEESERARYAAFVTELVDLVVNRHDGSLKAEHGTGINMAPFVAAEWGEKATAMMWRIKELADPHGILGPNVILTRNPNIHMEALKSIPVIEGVSDAAQCIECGFCEPVCPSRNVTTTPRQRIVIRREMARQPDGSAVLHRLQHDYQYDAIDTCAGDGSCATACPVGINTGSLMRSFRAAGHGEQAETVALAIARRWSLVERLSRGGLRAADVVQQTVGTAPLRALTAAARLAICEDLLPAVPGPMPHPAPRLPQTDAFGFEAVYFPACINRMFGRDPDRACEPGLAETLVKLSKRAGKPLWIPDDVAGLCCATPFSSKGYVRAHDHMAAKMADALWDWSNGGRWPVVVDAVSCTLGLVQELGHGLDAERAARLAKIRIVDAISWCRDLLPALDIPRRMQRIVAHPTCSMNHLGLVHAFTEVLAAIADDPQIPLGAACCGTAGDRGLLHPELVVSATREERAAVAELAAEAWVSANRTCEMGMRHATGRPYESFIYLLEELSRPGAE